MIKLEYFSSVSNENMCYIIHLIGERICLMYYIVIVVQTYWGGLRERSVVIVDDSTQFVEWSPLRLRLMSSCHQQLLICGYLWWMTRCES